MAVIEWWDDEANHHLVEIPAQIILLLSFTETKKWILSEIEHVLDRNFK